MGVTREDFSSIATTCLSALERQAGIYLIYPVFLLRLAGQALMVSAGLSLVVGDRLDAVDGLGLR